MGSLSVMIRLVLFCLLAMPSMAHATRYWVDPSGDDTNACTSVDGDDDPGVYRATPVGGIACMSGGDRLTIKSGLYTGSKAVILLPSKGGTAANPTIIEGDPSSLEGCAISSSCPTLLRPNGAVTGSKINVSHVIIRKMRIDHQNMKSSGVITAEIQSPATLTDILVEDVEMFGTRISSTTPCGSGSGFGSSPSVSFVVLRRNHVHDVGNFDPGNPCSHGFYVSGDDALIEYNLVHDAANAGMQCYNGHDTSDGRPDRCTVRYNVFRNNQEGGILMEGFDNKVYGNLVYSNGGGIVLGYSGADRAHIYGNTIVNNTRDGLQIRATAPNVEAKNNIFFGNGNAVVQLAGVTGTVLSNNACSATQSCGTTGKLTISALTDLLVSASDFRLKSGSAAIGAGVTVADYACTSACDIGAFEAVPTPTASITANVVTLSFPIQNTAVPVQIPSAAGVSVACTGSVSCPGSPTVSAATRKTGTDIQVVVTVSGITGNACANTQTWTISYSSTTGLWSDNARRGNTLNQPIFSFTNLATTNLCTGSGPSTPPSGQLIYYKFDDGAGTSANDETANNLDCTLTGGATWGSGKTGSALSVALGSNQYCDVPWGSGVNPSSQSITIFVPIFIEAGAESSLQYVGGPTLGTNQRAYICAKSGTWRVSIQGTSCSATAASNLTVTAGWNVLTLIFDSVADVATLYKSGTTGTGGATSAYTSFTFASNWRIGKLDTNTVTGNFLFDEFQVHLSVKDPVALTAAFDAVAPTLTGVIEQDAVQFQSVVLDTAGNPIIVAPNLSAIEVPAGGGAVILFQVSCLNVADCDPTGFKLVYDVNSSSAWQQVPDMETADGTWMWGTNLTTGINNGVRSTRLIGTCTLTDGSTQLTAVQTPSVDLPQNGCVVLAYIVRVGSSKAGVRFRYRLHTESDALFSGGYTSFASIQVVNPLGGGLGL